MGSRVKIGENIRIIDHNTEGYWVGSNIGTTRVPIIHLADADGTEATSGTCELWYKRVLVIENVLAAGLQEYRGLRLVIDAQGTREGYFEIGTMAWSCHSLIWRRLRMYTTRCPRTSSPTLLVEVQPLPSTAISRCYCGAWCGNSPVPRCRASCAWR